MEPSGLCLEVAGPRGSMDASSLRPWKFSWPTPPPQKKNSKAVLSAFPPGGTKVIGCIPLVDSLRSLQWFSTNKTANSILSRHTSPFPSLWLGFLDATYGVTSVCWAPGMPVSRHWPVGQCPSTVGVVGSHSYRSTLGQMLGTRFLPD